MDNSKEQILKNLLSTLLDKKLKKLESHSATQISTLNQCTEIIESISSEIKPINFSNLSTSRKSFPIPFNQKKSTQLSNDFTQPQKNSNINSNSKDNLSKNLLSPLRSSNRQIYKLTQINNTTCNNNSSTSKEKSKNNSQTKKKNIEIETSPIAGNTKKGIIKVNKTKPLMVNNNSNKSLCKSKQITNQRVSFNCSMPKSNNNNKNGLKINDSSIDLTSKWGRNSSNGNNYIKNINNTHNNSNYENNYNNNNNYTKGKNKVIQRNSLKNLNNNKNNCRSISNLSNSSSTSNIHKQQNSDMSTKLNNNNPRIYPNFHRKKNLSYNRFEITSTNTNININNINNDFYNYTNYNSNQNINNSTNKCLILENIENMEASLQNGLNIQIQRINNEENLLNSPLEEAVSIDYNNNYINYNTTCNLPINSQISNQSVSHPLSYPFIDLAESHLPLITLYLTKPDILTLMTLNKSFNTLVKSYLLSSLEKEKKTYESKLTSHLEAYPTLSKSIPPEYTLSQIGISKGTMKALTLLNENILNNIFSDPSSIPSDNILKEYLIYFQLINHPLSKEIFNKKFFWDKCCKYFNSIGKIGDLLEKNILNDFVLTSDNVYKVVRIVGDKVREVSPVYFTKISSFTGLLAFVIKDALDFIGISEDKMVDADGGRRYWTYMKVIEAIEKRIEYMKKIT